MRGALYTWANNHQDAPFNDRGYYCNFIPPASCCTCCAYDAQGKSYFCAEQVAAAMKEIGVSEADGIVPHISLPDEIYHRLHRAGGKLISINAPQVIRYASHCDKFSPPISLTMDSASGSNRCGSSSCCCRCCDVCCCCGWCCRRYDRNAVDV
jgi:hypothetical protein